MEYLKNNLFLFFFAWTKIPLIGFCSARIIESNEQRTVVKIPLNWRTRNHLKVMYFGALSVGADICVGMVAINKIRASRAPIDLLFKDFKINFLKRAEGDVHFICDDGLIISEQIAQAKTSEERINRTIKGYAVVPSINSTDKVAEFELTLSVKRRVKKSN